MVSLTATCGTNRRQGWKIGGLALAGTLITGGVSACSEARIGSLPPSSSSGSTSTSSSIEQSFSSPLPSPGAPETASVTQAPTAQESRVAKKGTATPTTQSRKATSSQVTSSAYPRVWVDCANIGLEPNSDSIITHLRIYSSYKNGCSGATSLAMEVARRGSFLDPPNTFTMFSGLYRCSKKVDNTALAKADYRCEDIESITTWTRT